jgi:hypothetical protein
MFIFTRLVLIIARDTYIKLLDIFICCVKRDERSDIISEHETMIKSIKMNENKGRKN